MSRFPHRTILSLTGPDTLALLERTVTHTVSGWEVGAVRYGALLTPQGKILADYIAHRTQDGVLIDVHEDAASDLLKRLTLFRLRSQVTLKIEEDLISATRPDAQPDPRSPALPHRAIVPLSETPSILEDWDALCIAACVPEWGRDYRSAEVFPTDVNMDLMNGVDYKKGCFVGQEVASRMKRKSLIRKRTVRITGTEPETGGFEAGAEVRAGAQLLGALTSAKADQGLALLRTDRLAKALAEGAALTVNDHPVTLTDTPWLVQEIQAHQAASAND